MHRYRNTSGESGVLAYDIGQDSITIQFQGGERYLYTERSAGAENIARMQELAREGRGLSTFVSQHIRSRYARKLN
ncbi:hypothetical protein [Massilia sp. MS-15]|uniref:hypothetical protein n=1 Tax=Massilia sp. MS-15 TaxID=2878200 RepID=UPI001CD7A86B|nr:hypothetical protein [Massilia sp. MS-15]MCA1247224.1 hypothetical protein [Massilia sp. MS-15]